jgi:sorting nexin-29
LRYGDAISPLLFNIVLENAIRRSKVESLDTTFYKYRQIMVCADDVFIMERRLQDTEEIFTSLVEKNR